MVYAVFLCYDSAGQATIQACISFSWEFQVLYNRGQAFNEVKQRLLILVEPVRISAKCYSRVSSATVDVIVDIAREGTIGLALTRP